MRDLTIYYAITNKLATILGAIKYDSFCGKLPENNGNICDKLLDLKEFVLNNNKKLQKSILLLAGAYKNDKPPTEDVENTLIQIADFHIQFLEKNNILNEVVTDLDRVINNPTAANNIDNINDIIQLRNILLVTNLDLAARIGDKENLAFIEKQKITSTDFMGDKVASIGLLQLSDELQSVLFSTDNSLGVFGVSPQLELQDNALGIPPPDDPLPANSLNTFSSKETLTMLFEGLFSEDDMNSIYTQENLNKALAQEGLKSLNFANSKLGIVFFNNEKLQPALSDEKLQQLGATPPPNNANEQLNTIMISTNLGSVVWMFSPSNIKALSQEDLNAFMSDEKLNTIMSEKGLQQFGILQILNAL